MGADGIDSVAADGVITLDDEVRGISFKTLHQASVPFWMAGKPSGRCDGVAQFVFCASSTAATACTGWDEVAHHRIQGSEGNSRD